MTAPMLPAVILAAALSGGPGSTGVGIGASDVCLSTQAQPGGSYQPGAVYVTDTGSGTETIGLQAGPLPSMQAGTIVKIGGTWRDIVQTEPHPEDSFAQHALPVPPAWVTFGYPHLLWVIAQHSVTLAPGQGASIAVTLHVPAGARHGQYEAALTAGTPAPGDGGGAQAVLGAAAATNLEFSVDAAPPDCHPAPAPQPWWAAPPAAGSRLAAGWSYRPGRDSDGDVLLSGVWTYLPPPGSLPSGAPGGTPPGWAPGAQMQVWTYDGGSTFVMNHAPGWQYLSGTGPLGTTLYQPPGGELPGWALRLAAGESYTLPATAPAVTVTGPPASAAPASSAGMTGFHVTGAGVLAAAVAVAGLAAAALTRGTRRTRRLARGGRP